MAGALPLWCSHDVPVLALMARHMLLWLLWLVGLAAVSLVGVSGMGVRWWGSRSHTASCKEAYLLAFGWVLGAASFAADRWASVRS